MELTASNVIKSLSEIAPYIEADGGFVEFVEIEEETKFVKVRLGGACTSCAMSAMTLKQGIENKIMQDIPCLLYTSPSPRDATLSRMPSSA